MKISHALRKSEKFANRYKCCPICKEKYTPLSLLDEYPRKYDASMLKRSRDHILPKCRINSDFRAIQYDGTTRNIMIMCAGCNLRRANNNHCIAALILGRLVNGDKRFYRK